MTERVLADDPDGSVDRASFEVLDVYSDGSRPSLVGALGRTYDDVMVLEVGDVTAAELSPSANAAVVVMEDLGRGADIAVRLLGGAAERPSVRLAVLPASPKLGPMKNSLGGLSAQTVERIDGVPFITLTRSAAGPAADAVLWAIAAMEGARGDTGPTDAEPRTLPSRGVSVSDDHHGARVPAKAKSPSQSEGRKARPRLASRIARRPGLIAGTLAIFATLIAVVGGVAHGRWAAVALWGLVGGALATVLFAIFLMWRNLRRLTRLAVDMQSGQVRLSSEMQAGQASLRQVPTELARVARTSGLTLRETNELALRAVQELRSGREGMGLVSTQQKAILATLERQVGGAEGEPGAMEGRITAALMREGRMRKGLLESFMQLQRVAPVDRPMPLPGGWAASEDLLLLLVERVLAKNPRLVLDIGSGQSTVWMAAALRAMGSGGRVVALDHDGRFAAATLDLVRAQGLESWVEVRHSPLVKQQVDGRSVVWYDPSMIADVGEIDLVSVDGPPAATGPQARWPALPLLALRLAPGAEMILDDLVRRDEREVADLWHESFPDWEVERLDHLEKRAVVFRAPEGVHDSRASGV